ncbi:MAG: NfeD family protein [Parabacteroides sp.]|nr:NfeD family protein [Parabacteroides sp.]
MFAVFIITFLLITSVILILLEIFLFPGITVAGIGGFIFAVGGLYYAYKLSWWTGNIALIATLITFGIAFIWMLRAKSLSRIALKTNVDSKLASSKDMGIKVGDEGVTVSRLAPIGKASINGIIVEAKSLDELIEEKSEVTVIRVEGYNVIVKRKNK